MTARPLICRTPDGRRYTRPSRVPDPSGYLAAREEPQSASDGETAPEPTPRGRRKLTDDAVRAILDDYYSGEWSQKDLAYIYSVNQATIHGIVRGKTRLAVKRTPQPQEQD